MEWTEANHVDSPSFQLNELTNHLFYAGGFQYLFNCFVRNHRFTSVIDRRQICEFPGRPDGMTVKVAQVCIEKHIAIQAAEFS